MSSGGAPPPGYNPHATGGISTASGPNGISLLMWLKDVDIGQGFSPKSAALIKFDSNVVSYRAPVAPGPLGKLLASMGLDRKAIHDQIKACGGTLNQGGAVMSGGDFTGSSGIGRPSSGYELTS